MNEASAAGAPREDIGIIVITITGNKHPTLRGLTIDPSGDAIAVAITIVICIPGLALVLVGNSVAVVVYVDGFSRCAVILDGWIDVGVLIVTVGCVDDVSFVGYLRARDEGDWSTIRVAIIVKVIDGGRSCTVAGIVAVEGVVGITFGRFIVRSLGTRPDGKAYIWITEIVLVCIAIPENSFALLLIIIIAVEVVEHILYACFTGTLWNNAHGGWLLFSGRKTNVANEVGVAIEVIVCVAIISEPLVAVWIVRKAVVEVHPNEGLSVIESIAVSVCIHATGNPCQNGSTNRAEHRELSFDR